MLSTLKVISLYSIMVSLTAFWRSFLTLTFGEVDSTLSFLVSTMHSCLFCNPKLIYKIFFFCTIVNASLNTSKYPYHLNHSTHHIFCFLHQCIYTFQHVIGDVSFYFLNIPSQSLTLLLHCNTRRMEHLDYKNLS